MIRRWTEVGLLALLVASLTALPATPALAGSASPSTNSAEGAISIDVPVQQLGSIASSLPVSELGLDSPGLEELLTTLPGLTGLNPIQQVLLQTLLSGLPPNATVNDLLESTLSQLGVDIAPAQLLGALASAAQNPAEVAQVLSDLAGALNPTQLTQLQGILGALAGVLPSGELSQLQSNLTTLLSGLSAGKLQPILGSLENVLSGSGLTRLQTLLENLGSLTPAQLQTQLQELLSELTPAQLSALLAQMFGSLNPTQLQPTVAGLLGGLSFSPTTAGQLAGSLGMPLEQFASTVGTTTEDLPAGLPAIAAPLGNGQLLSMLNGLGGLGLSLLGPGSQPGGGGSGGSEGSTGPGSGSSGGSGGAGGPSGTTVIVSAPPVSATTGQATGAARGTTAKKLARIKFLSHRVRGNVATVVVRVPTAGTLTLSGVGVRSMRHSTSRAGRITLRIHLSKAGKASLHRHRNYLKVKIRAAFKPSRGAGSSTTATLTFR